MTPESIRLPALDGYELGGTLYPADSADTVVTIHGATAVPSRFYADMIHQPGEDGRKAILDPPPATMAEVRGLGTFRAA